MKLTENYGEKAAAFGKDFIEHLIPYPFGGMSKRDLDCLIFFLLKKHGLIPGDMNRNKAYNLNISESKYKLLLVDSDAKFGGEHTKETIEANVRKIFERLCDGNNPDNGMRGVSLEGDTLVFIEEDSVVKDDFEYAMKSAGFCTDTSFNSEIIKVKAAGFLAFALEKKYITEDQILAFLDKDKADVQFVEIFKNAKKTKKEIMQDILGILKKQEKLDIHTFFELFAYAKVVFSAKWSGLRS